MITEQITHEHTQIILRMLCEVRKFSVHSLRCTEFTHIELRASIIYLKNVVYLTEWSINVGGMLRHSVCMHTHTHIDHIAIIPVVMRRERRAASQIFFSENAERKKTVRHARICYARFVRVHAISDLSEFDKKVLQTNTKYCNIQAEMYYS